MVRNSPFSRNKNNLYLQQAKLNKECVYYDDIVSSVCHNIMLRNMRNEFSSIRVILFTRRLLPLCLLSFVKPRGNHFLSNHFATQFASRLLKSMGLPPPVRFHTSNSRYSAYTDLLRLLTGSQFQEKTLTAVFIATSVDVKFLSKKDSH